MFNKGNMSNMLKQAREVQKRIEEVQADLENISISAESGGGLVSVVINGKQEVLELNISEEALGEDKELLELPNFIVTPHIGGSANEAIMAMGRAAIEGLENAVDELMGI